MMKPAQRRPLVVPSEQGYILVWVMFLLTAFTIWLAVAVPRAAKEIQRDRERETMERGKQYERAVQLYYRRFHAYPPNQNALVNTNEIRFLRKKYIDPTTGKDDWKPILWGQAKTQTLGFFGQPLTGAGSAGGSMLAGVGPSGNGGINGGSSISSPGFGSSPGSNSSIFSSNDSGTSSTTGSTGTSTGSPTTPAGTTGSSTGSSGSSSNSGLNGQTFGGAGIVGFSPASPRPSILIYKKKNHYNEWEFVYDPVLEMKTISGNSGGAGLPGSSTTNPAGSSGLNNSSGLNSSGSSNNSSNSGANQSSSGSSGSGSSTSQTPNQQ